ncbi:MAG: ATP-binding protein [Gammaproteobacteria bacterium]|jgi:two-component system, NtrC family, sensor kinase
MNGPDTQSLGKRLRTSPYRSIWLPSLISFCLLLVALGLLVGISWLNVHRLEPLSTHLRELSRVQDAQLRLQEELVRSLSQGTSVSVAQLHHLRGEVTQIMNDAQHLLPQTSAHLKLARQALSNLQDKPEEALILTLGQLRQVITQETRAHEQLLSEVRRNTELEFHIALAIVILLPLASLLALFILRKRILLPLDNLSTLMSLLAKQDYSTANAQGADPLIEPLIQNYNVLVSRLAELEAEHRSRHADLEAQVRSATQTLLQLQRTLANSERLAAVGEVTARFAHELRNPMAGIQMALSNLLQETDNPEHCERLELVIRELHRITQLINSLLDQSHHQPEAARKVELNTTIKELLSLVRYQTPENIRLDHDVAQGLRCLVPEDRLRQTLINLVLNAEHAIGAREGQIILSAEPDSGKLVLRVSDNGPGFPDTLIEHGIRPFVSGRANGTGLGLSMVERFARDLGGQIELSNKPTGGACVTLRLPCLSHDA